MNTYVTIIENLPVGDSTYNVAFKKAAFNWPNRGVINTEEMVEADKAILEEIAKLKGSRKKDDQERILELLSKLKTAELVESYIQHESKSSIFDIISKEEVIEATTDKLSLVDENEQLRKRIEELEALAAKSSEGDSAASEGKEQEDV